MELSTTEKVAAGALLFLLFAGKSSAVVPKDQRSNRERVLSYVPLVKDSISRYEPKVPLELALAVMHVESGGSKTATSYKRHKKRNKDKSKNPLAGQYLRDASGNKIPLAKGLMQLIEGTAAYLGVPWDYTPETNIEGGVKLLSELYAKYGNWAKVLAHYNSGSPNVITRKEYIDAVNSKIPLYKNIK